MLSGRTYTRWCDADTSASVYLREQKHPHQNQGGRHSVINPFCSGKLWNEREVLSTDQKVDRSID
jgi:hypothetical protein